MHSSPAGNNATTAHALDQCICSTRGDKSASMSFPPKIALLHGAIWTPSNTWFLGPTRVHNQNSASGPVVRASGPVTLASGALEIGLLLLLLL